MSRHGRHPVTQTENVPANPIKELRKEMGFWDVLFFNIATVLGPRWVAAAAHNGTSSISLWILAALFFFVPTALVINELSSRFPNEGGLYVWSTVWTLSPRARHELRKSRTSSSSGVGPPLGTVESRGATARSYTFSLLAAKNSTQLTGLWSMPVDRLECALGGRNRIRGGRDRPDWCPRPESNREPWD